MRATHAIDEYCTQVLRATVDVEEMQGPDFWLTVQRTGMARMQLARFPVLGGAAGITKVEWAVSNTFPLQYNTVPTGMYTLENIRPGVLGTNAPDSAGVGSVALLVAPGFVDWRYGRNGYRLRATYMNGWPHGQLTSSATLAATTLALDDVTGYAVGGNTKAAIFDGASTEQITVSAASAASGPGTLTLTSGTAASHAAGALVSTLPFTVQQAAIYFSVAFALVRGATAVTAPPMPGSLVHSMGSDPHEYQTRAQKLLTNFRRVV